MLYEKAATKVTDQAMGIFVYNTRWYGPYAANVGGIPEIFGSHGEALFAPNNAAAMADAIESALDDPAAAQQRAESLRERIFLHFSQKAMVEGVLAGYRDAFANR